MRGNPVVVTSRLDPHRSKSKRIDEQVPGQVVKRDHLGFGHRASARQQRSSALVWRRSQIRPRTVRNGSPVVLKAACGQRLLLAGAGLSQSRTSTQRPSTCPTAHGQEPARGQVSLPPRALGGRPFLNLPVGKFGTVMRNYRASRRSAPYGWRSPKGWTLVTLGGELAITGQSLSATSGQILMAADIQQAFLFSLARPSAEHAPISVTA